MNIASCVLSMIGLVVSAIIAVSNLFTHNLNFLDPGMNYTVNNQGLGIAAFLIFWFISGFVVRSVARICNIYGMDLPEIVALVIFIVISATIGLVTSVPGTRNYGLALFSWAICLFMTGFGTKAWIED